MANNHSTKIIRAILEAPNLAHQDILYALQLAGSSVSRVAVSCGCSPEFVYMVIKGDKRSFDVATYIADKLNTTTTRLWGDAYNYTPRTGKQQPLKTVANA
ncbi:MAG: hypothetical protein M0P11_06960 [Anaerolineaceae bacterium]|nr:hypothetical protein [Anaerolineaceae bacterium]